MISGIVLFSLACSIGPIRIDPVTAKVTRLSACESVDKDGNPIGEATEFSANIERIFACGYLETNEPMDIEILWYYEDEVVFQQFGPNIKGNFFSYVESGRDTFVKGTYRIEILIGNGLVGQTEFEIK